MKSDSALKNQEDHWSLSGPETAAICNLFHIAVNKQTLQLSKELYETLECKCRKCVCMYIYI